MAEEEMKNEKVEIVKKLLERKAEKIVCDKNEMQDEMIEGGIKKKEKKQKKRQERGGLK